MTDKPSSAEFEGKTFKDMLAYIHDRMAGVTEDEVLAALAEDEARERRQRARKRSSRRAASSSTRTA